MRSNRLAGWMVVAAAAALATSGTIASERPPDAAAEILKLTGLRGGLIVHLGCGDGKVTAGLGEREGFLVQGLDTAEANVRAARQYIESLGLYGRVSAQRLVGSRLPYGDNMVNLVVVQEGQEVPREELLRVTTPGGALCLAKGGTWTVMTKPRPAEMGDWRHYLCDSGNNAVSPDRLVGPPAHLQWTDEPKYSRNHEYMSSVSAIVSAGGRLFQIIDEGSAMSILLPARWSLVARDAFNGVVLWRRPLETWQAHLWAGKSGPVQVTRRLVCDETRVYAPLGASEPLSILDAASGTVLATCPVTRGLEEIICAGQTVLALVNPAGTVLHVEDGAKTKTLLRDYDSQRRIVALAAADGRVLWQKDCPSGVLPLTLAAADGDVFYHDGQAIICLNIADGKQQWRTAVESKTSMTHWYAPTLVVNQGTVLYAWKGALTALETKTGHRLWSATCAPSQYQSPTDVLVAGGLVWTTDIVSLKASGQAVGRDSRTGQIRKTIQIGTPADIGMVHHRCHRAKGAGDYLLTSRAGVEFVDTRTGTMQAHNWVRGACLYGILACNGLLYAPPHPCGCYIKAKLTYFNALAPQRPGAALAVTERLEQGPAYGQKVGQLASGADTDAWPTYRHDAGRSGCTTDDVPAQGLAQRWSAKLGGALSSVTVSEGRVFVAAVDAHSVYALDGATGQVAWKFTAGGRIDSPPTIHRGLAVFGSADGWVYCVRVSDGQLVWRFCGAGQERRIVARGQLESAWPVSGSVLIVGEEAFFAAGRSSFLDGGIRLVRVDLAGGKCLSETVVYDIDPKTGRQPAPEQFFAMEGALPDILSFQGGRIYMRHRAFDGQGQQVHELGVHLFSAAGFLDDSWWHRAYWLYGSEMKSGFIGWRTAFNNAPAGRILAYDDANVVGFGRVSPYLVGTLANGGEAYHLFCAFKQFQDKGDLKIASVQGPPAKAPPPRVAYRWACPLPIQTRAMAVTPKLVLAAGPVGPGTASIEEYQGKRGARLLVVSRADGKTLAQYDLPSGPVFDAMVVAGGRIYLAGLDGKVTCWSRP